MYNKKLIEKQRSGPQRIHQSIEDTQNKKFMKTFALLFGIAADQSISQVDGKLENGILGITETTLTLAKGESLDVYRGDISEASEIPLFDVAEMMVTSSTVRFVIKSSSRLCTLEFKAPEEAENFHQIFGILTNDGFDDPRFDAEREKDFAATLRKISPTVYVTPGIMIATAAYFVIQLLNGGTFITLDSRIAIDLGANFGLETLNGGWWRLFSSMFIHFGAIHLLLNMVALAQVGGYVERMYGSRHFLVIYFLSGLSGSVLSLLMNPTVVSAGASGAVFGVYGAFIAFATRKSLGVPASIAKSLLGSTIPFVAYNLFYGFTAKGSGVDNWAHIGGLLGGLFTGFVMAREVSANRKQRDHKHLLVTSLIATGVVGVIAVLVFFAKGTYDAETAKKLGEYADNKATVAFEADDYQTALAWFEKGAKRSNAHSIYSLGYIYLNGKGVPKDEKNGFSYYRLAADHGSAEAQGNLGTMYAFGHGVTQDYKEAIRLFRLAADQGRAYAQFNLGLMYDGGRGVSQDYKEAVRWYRLAADQGYAAAQYNLGVKYHKGEGVQQDYKEELKWYKLAADQGEARAQFNIGWMYQYGQGVSQDYKESVKWYRLAADQGNFFAIHNLALIFDKGLGVPSNRVVAYGLYNLSASDASSSKNETTINRTKLAESMSSQDIDAAQALANEMANPGQLLIALDQYLNKPTIK